MPRLPNTLCAWNSDAFAATLKREIEALPPGSLPLLKGLSRGGCADDANITATLLSSREEAGNIHAQVGIFFNEIIAGCSCGEEPMPLSAYCELRVSIDKTSAEAGFAVAD